MYQCFHCGLNGVIWDGDFDFEDYGFEGEGIVHHCHCMYCGAEIEYYVPIRKHKYEIEVRTKGPLTIIAKG